MTRRPELEGVAIVGLACRFPGAPTVEAYWELMRSGREAIRRFTADELRAAGVPREVLEHPLYVPARGMLENVDQFDADFFHLSPRDADLLDPQQRLWLECAWEALEDAGYHGATCGKSVGVFAGSRLSTYLLHNLCGNRQETERIAAAGNPDAYQILLGNDKDLLPTRTSYLLDLHGPSLAVQTACSSSLVAVAQACQSLLTWQCDLCLAGGACVMVPSVQGYRYQPGGIASPDGHCRAFDARAQGTVFGDGVGAVLLKREAEAVADGDAIYAVIRGFAVNNDGTGKVSIAAPSVDGQAEVVALAQAMGGVDPRSVTYVEAHGTGTALGDPVEVAALTKAFRLGTGATGFCGLGSVKTNIGHADAAAGIAGLIKTALALQHRQIPPTLHFETPNPAIELERSPFFVVRELTPWPSDGRPRRAGVSSLGVGGTNCHVVLEEAPRPALRSVATERPRHLLTLSARSELELRNLAKRYADHLASRPDDALADVCFTANTGRAMFQQRLAAVAGTCAELRERLATFAAAGAATGATEPGAPPAVAFLFTGQGAIYAGMGRDLYDTQPVFRTALDRCDAALRSSLDRSLIDLLYHGPDGDRMLERADYAQPALVAVEVALAELWRSWGIVPDRLLGHSIGELAAACVAGVFTLEDGLRLVAERARLFHALPEPGVMVAALASEEQVTRALGSSGGAAIAAFNAPWQVVLSGENGAVEAALAELRAMGVETRPLQVSHAFHSPVMDPVLDPFERVAAGVPLAQPRIELISSVSGAPAGAEIASVAYWRGQIRHPVRFTEAFAALESRGPTLLIEIGPHPVLLGLARLCSSGASRALLPSLDRHRPGWATILESLGRLYEHGRSVDWRGFDAPYQRRRLHLPTYPFRRRRHWVEPSDAPDAPAGDAAVFNPLLGRRLPLPLSSEIRFETRLSARAVPLLNDHRLFGTMVLAASSQFALFLSAVEAAFGPQACDLEDTTFRRPLLIPDEGVSVVQVLLAPLPNEDATYEVQLVSRPDSSDPLSAGAWTLHATSHLRLHDAPPAAAAGNPAALRPPGASELAGETFYEERWAPGAGTGPAFRRIEAIWRCDRRATARVTTPDSPECAGGYPLHPGVIEACFQTLFHAGTFETRALAEQGVLYVPFTVERFGFQGRSAARRWWCHGRARESYPAEAPAKRGDMRLLDDEGRLVAEITGFEVRRLRRELVQGDGGRPDDLLHRVVWEPRNLGPARTSLQGDWLVLAAGDGDGDRLAAALEARGAQVTVPDRTHPDALRPSSWAPESRTLRGIVYLAGPDQAAAEAECANLLQLAQALVSDAAPPRLWLVTRHTQAVVPDDALPGARLAALWGMARVIARELPRVGLTCVDLDGNAGHLAGLLDELEAGSESEVALRQGRRYVPRLSRYRPSLVDVGAEPSFREHATYLVTDGISSQGQVVADWLVRHGARHLILSSAAGSSPASYEEARVVQVRSDPQRPEVSVARLRDAWATMPPLAGIFHLDLPMDDGVVPRQTRERLRTALAGAALAWALHEETRSLGLDCFVCFSTSAALLGTPGQSTYAAAGAAVDALVQHRRRQGLAGLSVNWGPWAEAGKAAALSPVLRQRLRHEGWMPLATATAMEVLEDLLRADVAQAVVLPIDWGRYLTAQSPGGSAAFLERVAGERDEKPRPEAPRDITESEDRVTEHLRRVTAEVLGLAREEIGAAESLFELGLDSLGALRLENRIRASLGTSVPMATILQAPSLRAIAAAVAARRREKA